MFRESRGGWCHPVGNLTRHSGVMSLVSSVGSTGRNSGESYRTGDEMATGNIWRQNAPNMAVQYRPDLGSISLNPPFCDSGGVTPFGLDVGTVAQATKFSPLPLNRRNDFYAPTAIDQSCQSLLSTKQSLLEAQHQRILRAIKMTNCASSISPLSPQESVPTILQSTFHPPRSLESYRVKPNDGCVQSRVSSFYGDPSFRDPLMTFCRDVKFSDLPIVRGPAAFQLPANVSSNIRQQINTDNAVSLKLKCDSLNQLNGESEANEPSKRLKRTLEELEKEL
eukprot:c22527_g3_i1 orf=2-838(-)